MSMKNALRSRLAFNHTSILGFFMPNPYTYIYWAAISSFLAILAFPLTVDTVPPLLDYPIHLARSYITIQHSHDQILSNMFDIHWRPLPNLASDISLFLLANYFDIQTAGRILIFICISITFLGVVFLHRINFGQWSWWPFLAAIPTYHGALSAGFINYSIGIALIPWFLALSKIIGRYHIGYQITFNTFASLVLFFCHVISTALFGLYFLGHKICHHLGSKDQKKLNGGIYVIALFTPFVLPVILYIKYSLVEVLDRENRSIIGIWDFDSKIRGILMPFISGDYVLDILSLLFFASIFVYFIFTKKLICSHHFFPGIFLIVALFFLLPGKMLDASFIADRLPISILIMAIASTHIKPIKSRHAACLAVVVLALTVGRTTSMVTSWTESSQYYRRLDGIASMVEKGSAVMILSPMTGLRDKGIGFWHNVRMTSPNWHFALINAPTLHSLSVVPLTERAVFSQLHFVWSDKQILSLAASYRDLDFGDGGDSTWKPEIIFERSPSMSSAIERFDYALLVYADRLAPELRRKLENQSPLYSDQELMLLRLPSPLN